MAANPRPEFPQEPKLVFAHPGSWESLVPKDAPDVVIWRDDVGSVCAFGYDGFGSHWMHFPQLASFRFGDSTSEVTAFPEHAARPEMVIDTFQRCVVPMVLQAQGDEVLHASAVRTDSGIVAFCATAGTGKSTVAFGLGRRGYPLWADDAVAFRSREVEFEAIPLAFRMRLRPESACFFGGSPLAEATGAEPVTLSAVCVLERASGSGRETPVRISRLSPSSAFTAALTHAYSFNLKSIDRKRKMVENYFSLVERVPVFQVLFQPGLRNLAAILDRLETVVLG